MLRELVMRVRSLLRRDAVEREMEDELRFHFDACVAKHVAGGATREEALRLARLEFGAADAVKEECREVRWGAWISSLAQDLRYALRVLRKSPGFACVAILTLALGIGANTAVFSLIDALLLRSLAVPAPEKLARISFDAAASAGGDGGSAAAASSPLSGPMFDRLRERQSAFTDLFAWTNSPMVLSEGGVARPVRGAYATGSAFPTLEITARAGRLLNWQDDDRDASVRGFAAVISEAFWLEHFGGAADAVGRAIVVNGTPATIVGVMPQTFNGITVDYAPEVVLPFAFEVALHGSDAGRFNAEQRWLFTMGRLKSGVSLRQAESDVDTIAGGVIRDSLSASARAADSSSSSSSLRGARLVVSPGRAGSSPLGEIYRRPLWTLQALVGLLMLICCGNLANLQLSRSMARQREIAVRSALGAGRWRLVRQVIAESAVLAIAGAAAGLALSQWMSVMLVRYVEQSDFPVFLDLRLNAAGAACTLALAVAAVIVAGLLPMLRCTSVDMETALRTGTRSAMAAKRPVLAARLLPMQVAASVLLASVALLFAASARKVFSEDLGFQVRGATLFSVNFERLAAKGEARTQVYRDMLDAIRRAPGVQAASVFAVRPLSDDGEDGHAEPVEGNGPADEHSFRDVVGPEYFAAAGTKLLSGREFAETDRAAAPPVCILSAAAAKFFFGRANAVGAHVRTASASAGGSVASRTCEVVGVVADAKYASVREAAPRTIYFPYEQAADGEDLNLGLITRSGDTATAVAAFNDALRKFAPGTPIEPAVTMQRQLEDSVGQERLLATVTLFLGVLAILLTSIGLYGMGAQRVAQRTQEIGLRMALGAQRGDMMRMVLREAGTFFAIGVPVGIAAAVGASRVVGSLLYGVSAVDARLLGAAVTAVFAAGAVAAYLPARRAMRVDPMVALRHE